MIVLETNNIVVPTELSAYASDFVLYPYLHLSPWLVSIRCTFRVLNAESNVLEPVPLANVIVNLASSITATLVSSNTTTFVYSCTRTTDRGYFPITYTVREGTANVVTTIPTSRDVIRMQPPAQSIVIDPDSLGLTVILANGHSVTAWYEQYIATNFTVTVQQLRNYLYPP